MVDARSLACGELETLGLLADNMHRLSNATYRRIKAYKRLGGVLQC